MKSKFAKILIFALMAILIFGTVSASAYQPYTTYTFSLEGTVVESPMAYYPYGTVSLQNRAGITSTQIIDMVSDDQGYIYISDKQNKEIVILDESFTRIHSIKTFVDKYGEEQVFGTADGDGGPEGIFVSKPGESGESYIYVCDPTNKRVVMFNRDFTYHDTIEEPDSKVIDDANNVSFKPQRIAVDQYGRMFISSSACDRGIFVLSPEGDFNGFIGAQKSSGSAFSQFLMRFYSAEKRAEMATTKAPTYSSITIDDDGFIYATVLFKNLVTDTVDNLQNQFNAIAGKDPVYSPVKKFNAKGTEILARNGFFDPQGEVAITNKNQVSTLIDIDVGAEGAWTILDKSRSRTYTYDQQGNLLYAFGGTGDQLGNISSAVAMCYQVIDGEYRMIILDYTTTSGNVLNVFTPTSYANAITNALRNENNHNYSESIDAWQDVLTENNNLDLAYIGMGKAYYYQGRYEEAMEMLKSAYDTEYYAEAYAESRNDIVSKWLVPIVILVIVLIVLVLKFLGYAKKKNKAASVKVGKKTYWEELLFVFHLVFHPFDGFWDLKHEKRGSVRAATTILGLTVIAFFYQSIGQGYMFKPRPGNDTIFIQLLSIVVPVALWVISNWCLTTLFDGEGSMKDIYIATCYSLAPLPVFVTISTVLTNVLSISEQTIVDMFVYVAVVWMVILLFFGMVVTHDYTIGKNIITTAATIVAAVIIMFVFLLFANLVAKMTGLISALYNEIANRL